jgi:uncharacterized membrane protein YhfC
MVDLFIYIFFIACIILLHKNWVFLTKKQKINSVYIFMGRSDLMIISSIINQKIRKMLLSKPKANVKRIFTRMGVNFPLGYKTYKL